jgi:hypothetical protein
VYQKRRGWTFNFVDVSFQLAMEGTMIITLSVIPLTFALIFMEDLQGIVHHKNAMFLWQSLQHIHSLGIW